MNELNQILTDINARKQRLNDTAEVCKLTRSAVHFADTDKDQLGEDIAWAVAEIERLENLLAGFAASAQKNARDTALIDWFEKNCGPWRYTVNYPWGGSTENHAAIPAFRAMVGADIEYEARNSRSG